jgi:hypothetical protein
MAASALLESSTLALGELVEVWSRSTAASHASVIITLIFFVILALGIDIFLFFFLFLFFLLDLFLVAGLHGLFLGNLALQLAQLIIVTDQLHLRKLDGDGLGLGRTLGTDETLPATSRFGDLDRGWRGLDVDIHVAICIGVGIFVLIFLVLFIFFFIIVIYNVVHFFIFILVLAIGLDHVAFLDMARSLALEDLASDELLPATARA